MQRYGQLIGGKPDQIEAYERMHAAVWPEVLAMIRACNIRTYSLFRHGTLLFAYREYVGADFAADMARMAADPQTQAWWTPTEPMPQPVAARAPGAWWTTMLEVFHTD